jgi:hypothetical protein
MADTSHGLRYPAGTKAFKAPAEQVELDKGFSHCQTQDYELKIVIPKGSSRREAMAEAHHATTLFLKKVALESLTDHINDLKHKTTKQKFIELCVEECKQVVPDSLGLEEPLQETQDEAVVKAKMEETYRDIVMKVRKAKDDEKKKNELKIKKEKELHEKCLQARPDTVLKDVISDIVKKQLCPPTEVDMTVDEGGGVQEAPAPKVSPSQDKLPAKVEALAKGLADVANKGKNDAKGKGKGDCNHDKANGKGKGKGKGKGSFSKNGASPGEASGYNSSNSGKRWYRQKRKPRPSAGEIKQNQWKQWNVGRRWTQPSQIQCWSQSQNPSAKAWSRRPWSQKGWNPRKFLGKWRRS